MGERRTFHVVFLQIVQQRGCRKVDPDRVKKNGSGSFTSAKKMNLTLFFDPVILPIK
jgi:hypothetical protein